MEGSCCLMIKLRRMLTLWIIKSLLRRSCPTFQEFLLFSWSGVLTLSRFSASMAVVKLILSASLTRMSWRILTKICGLVKCVFVLTTGKIWYSLLIGSFTKESQDFNRTELSRREFTENTNLNDWIIQLKSLTIKIQIRSDFN